MNSGMYGSSFRKISWSRYAACTCFFWSSVPLNCLRIAAPAAFEFRSKFPNPRASCPVGTTWDGSKCEKKYPYGVGSPPPLLQIKLGFVPLMALFETHAGQSGSILTDASMPTAWRFREMICSEATQSDQQPITCT